MKFTKMHGLGNDYVYVNGWEETVESPAALAQVVSDRHLGIGSDGLILVLPPDKGVDADVQMRMFNADGSESEMCGNGVRCVAKYAYDHGLTQAQPMRVQTGRGVLSIDYIVDEQNRLVTATVDMGEPILAAAQVPVVIPNIAETATVVDYDAMAAVSGAATSSNINEATWQAIGWDGRITCVSMGNPHVMLYCDDVMAVDLSTVGGYFESHAWFPHRINVHFVQVHQRNEVTVRHWERGSGPTLACGTGACAVCVAGVLTGRTDEKITAHLPGGDLMLSWPDRQASVMMTGPAVEVYQGVWPRN